MCTDSRTIGGEVQNNRRVYRVGISRQEQWAGMQQRIHHHNLVGFAGTQALHAASHALEGRRRYEVQEHIDAAHEIQVVVRSFNRIGIRHAIEEFELPDSRINGIRCHDFFRDVVVVTGRRFLCKNY
jgi:hypothetical protein